jgi:predicted nucleic acid-binding protein
MLIYLDMCCLQRPCDDRTQTRVRVEAEAVLGILARCESGAADLVSSDALEYEAGRNPHPVRRAFGTAVLSRAASVVRLTGEIEAHAGRLVAAGLKPLDALHLACAAHAGADYFCTCDDRLLRRALDVQTPPPKVISPVELVTELGL